MTELEMSDIRHSPDDLEVLRSSELFPKKQTVYDDGPIPSLTSAMHGENFLFCSRCGRDSNQYMLLTTYRLIVVQPSQWFFVVPVGILLSVDMYDTCTLTIKFKDGRACSVQFATAERCILWHSRLQSIMAIPTTIEDFFAFAFHAWLKDTNQPLSQQSPDSLSWFYSENTRLGFRYHTLWKTSDGNFQFELCRSYPRLTVVPASLKDTEMSKVAKFRSQHRYPAIVWRHRGNGAVLGRCSQPLVGLLGYQRCCEDEKLIEEIAKAVVLDRALTKGIITQEEAQMCTDDSSILKEVLGEEKAARIEAPSMLVVDMRSQMAAMANRSRGGGTESKDYYPCIEAVFHKVPNIHAVLQSFEALSALCQHQTTSSVNWMSQLESTQWLHYLSGLLESAVHIAHTLCVEARPVLVHCSDGWDRTSQATALTQLLVDPYYRTFEGFTILVKREWLAFGHKFASRCGHFSHLEPSPVFIQWLDAVHQLMQQFPMAFEYNETFLIKLATHAYSHLFGNFLCNHEKDRLDHTNAKTLDIWLVLNKDRQDFINYLYNNGMHEIIVPKFGVQHMVVWSRLLMNPVRQVMPGSTDVLEGPNLLSPVTMSSYEQNNPFDLSMRTSLQVLSCKPNTLLECLHAQQRNKDMPTGRRAGALAASQSLLSAGDPQRKLTRLKSSPPQSTAAVSRSPAQHIPRSRSIGQVTRQPSESEILSSSYEYVNWSPTMNTIYGYQPPPISGHRDSVGSVRASTSCAEPKVANVMVVSTPQRRRAAEQLASVHSVEEALPAYSPDTGIESATDHDMSSGGEGLATPRSEMLAVAMPLDRVTQTEAESTNSSTATMTSERQPLVAAGFSTSQPTAHIPCSHESRNGSSHRTQSAQSRSFPRPTRTPSNGNGVEHTNGEHGGKLSEDDSGCPSSPSSPSRSSRSRVVHEAVHVAQEHWLIPQHMLDADGLPLLQDPVQAHLYRIVRQQQDLTDALHMKIAEMQGRLKRSSSMLANARGSPDTPSGNSSKNSSLSSANASSREGSLPSQLSTSWESVQNGDGQPTRWVPDHAVNCCTECRTTFWVYVRRHHCRSCGGVFCGACSNYFMPVLKEQLADPVRVCCVCYNKLDGHQYWREEALRTAVSSSPVA